MAQERDYDERLAAIARELVHGPDMPLTLQRIIDLAAAPSMTTESRFAKLQA